MPPENAKSQDEDVKSNTKVNGLAEMKFLWPCQGRVLIYDVHCPPIQPLQLNTIQPYSQDENTRSLT
ncbi:Protein of unknown function [Pyronema omphalodes CBS 100304]|uniref:Uncharacterized protein n=1 Tax=Pyronema omphalodes (strain CBS 100304) TaxID=1076935 RepID=U4L8M8_PYROM|nr:Protein of unknown function [Pyronema omphalodes CBS 100304]